MLAAVGGIAAAANAQLTPQPAVTYNVSWQEYTGTSPSPIQDGAVGPGESAFFTISFNMVPPGGTPVTYPTSLVAGGAGAGVLRGMMASSFGIAGTGTDLAGAWANRNVNPTWTNILSSAGSPVSGQARVDNIAASQVGLIAEEPSIVGSAGIAGHSSGVLWTGRWTPTNYDARTINFNVIANTLGIAVGTAFARDNNFVYDPEDPNAPTNVAYAPAIGTVSHVFGSAAVPIIPAPSSLALLGLGGLVALRRRR
jgi:hypothetical protein